MQPRVQLTLAAALVLSLTACGSRLFYTPGPTPYERMSMIDCAADVASAQGFSVTERRVDEGFLLAEGRTTDAAASDTSHRIDLLTVAVSRESDAAPVAVRAESFVVKSAPTKERKLQRGMRAILGWARPSSRVVELRSVILDRCASLAAPRRTAGGG